MDTNTIQYISTMLDEPQTVSDADLEKIQNLTDNYPYFLPGRYIGAAYMQRHDSFGEKMMTDMQLYSANLLLFYEYISKVKDTATLPAANAGLAVPLKTGNPEVTANELHTQPSSFDELKEEKDELGETSVEQETYQDGTRNKLNQLIEQIHTTPDTEQLITERQKEKEAESLNIQTQPVEEEDPLWDAYSWQAALDEEAQNKNADDLSATGNTISSNEYVEFRPEVEIQHTRQDKQTAAPVNTEPEQVVKPVQDFVVEQVNFHQDAITNEAGETLILPIYTEDYFMHQGLKVSNDLAQPHVEHEHHNTEGTVNENKSLLVVMSFIEWLTHFKSKTEKENAEAADKKALKTMWQKERLAAAMGEENEEIPENVFEMAVNSITMQDSLVSESLAEIYERQGKFDKAIEMYRKLSLGNPNKNAYFVAKIEALLKEKQS